MNCYFTVGFGIAGQERDDYPPAIASGNPWEYEAPDGYVFETAGETGTWSFLMADSIVHCDHRGESYPNGMLHGATELLRVSYERERLMHYIVHDLGYDIVRMPVIGWKFLVTVR